MAQQTLQNNVTLAVQRTAINANFTELYAQIEALQAAIIALPTLPSNLFVNGLINTTLLPPDPLSPNQFETLSDGTIGLINYNEIGSGNINLPLSTLSIGTTTSTSIQLNWTAVSNTTGYNLQLLVGSTWTTIYTGTLLTYTASGLTASTSYQFRVVALPLTGYNSSISTTQIQSTSAAGGGVTYTPLTSFRTPIKDVVVSSNNVNYSTAATDSYGFAVSSLKVAASTPFEVRATTTSTSSTGFLSIIQSTTAQTYGSLTAAIGWTLESTNYGKFTGTVSGTGQDNYGGEVTLTSYAPILSISGTGSRIYLKGSIDNGVTFIEIEPNTVISQPSTDLYIETFFNSAPSVLNSIVETGLITGA